MFVECTSCQLEWSEWSECVDGFATREQFVAVEPRDGGLECGELGFEEEGTERNVFGCLH